MNKLKIFNKNGSPKFLNDFDKYFYETVPFYHFKREFILRGIEGIIEKIVKSKLQNET